MKLILCALALGVSACATTVSDTVPNPIANGGPWTGTIMAESTLPALVNGTLYSTQRYPIRVNVSANGAFSLNMVPTTYHVVFKPDSGDPYEQWWNVPSTGGPYTILGVLANAPQAQPGMFLSLAGLAPSGAAKGSILAFGTGGWSPLPPAGSDTYMACSDSTQTLGIRWCAPNSQPNKTYAVSNSTSFSVSASSHGFGINVAAYCVDSAGNFAWCGFQNDGAGNLTFGFNPAFTGTIVVAQATVTAGQGATGPAGAAGAAGATGATGPQGPAGSPRFFLPWAIYTGSNAGSLNWNAPDSNAPTASGRTDGGNGTVQGIALFAHAQKVYNDVWLPSNWTAFNDVQYGFTTTDTTNGHTIIFTVEAACPAAGSTDTATYSTIATGTTTIQGGAVSGQLYTAKVTATTPGACTANNLAHLRVTRSNSDTSTDTSVALTGGLLIE